MAEQVAAKKKRQRRVPSAVLFTIRIERSETVLKTSKEYGGQFGGSDATLPVAEKTLVLEQSLPESKFDLAKVIKAINGL